MSEWSSNPQAILDSTRYFNILIFDIYFSVISELLKSPSFKHRMKTLLAFYGYDILLKTSREIELIWRKPKTTSFLYIVARYATLPRLIIQVIQIENDPKTKGLPPNVLSLGNRCTATLYTADVFYILARASCLVVLTVQVWAIYSRDRRILLVLGLLSVSVVIGELLEMTDATCYSDKPDEVIWEKTSILLDAVMAAIVLVLSLYKLRPMVDWRESIRSFGTKTQFKYTSLVVSECYGSLIICRDLCRADYSHRAACALTVLQAIFIWLSKPFEAIPGELSFYSTPFVKPIEALLICSLLLQLHAAQQDPNSPTSDFIFSTAEIQVNLPTRESGWELSNMSESGTTPDTVYSGSTVVPDATRIDKGKGRAEQVDCVQRNLSSHLSEDFLDWELGPSKSKAEFKTNPSVAM
ncbi:hypothetical protein K439DRAFT_1623264 [Ramaria rubella]|nr:hypothetical protein K439DRAFT_1623264 [Ramaria rubella]